MLGDITLGQYYPGQSFVHRLDPRTKVLGLILFISAVFLADDYTGYGILLVFALISIAVAKIPFRLALKSVKPLWVIIVLTFCIHTFMTPGQVIASWGIFTVTAEGWRQAVMMSARLVLIILLSSLLTFTTSPLALTDGIERLLNPLRRFGLPAHELAMMMTIAMRFIPTLLEETDRIMKAQMARGAEFSSGNLLQRARNMVPLLVPLFISAFRRADELATAMEARCYRGGENRTRMKELKITRRDWLAAVVVFSLMGVLVFLRWGRRLVVNERNIKLTVAYDGTAYHGFQRQANALAIQQIIEERLVKLFGHSLHTIGAGRTDTGVHARGQVINFRTTGIIPVEHIPQASRGILPDDIVIMKAETVDSSFHARFDAQSKIYRYRILNTTAPDPLLRRYAWHYRWPLNAVAMQDAATVILGVHDFSAFRSAGGPPINPVRTMLAVHCERSGQDMIDLVFWGSGFLYHMVRNLVGTLIAVGRGQMSRAEFQEVLHSRDRQQAGAAAPPNGLCLEEVRYSEREINQENP